MSTTQWNFTYKYTQVTSALIKIYNTFWKRCLVPPPINCPIPEVSTLITSVTINKFGLIFNLLMAYLSSFIRAVRIDSNLFLFCPCLALLSEFEGKSTDRVVGTMTLTIFFQCGLCHYQRDVFINSNPLEVSFITRKFV